MLLWWWESGDAEVRALLERFVPSMEPKFGEGKVILFLILKGPCSN